MDPQQAAAAAAAPAAELVRADFALDTVVMGTVVFYVVQILKGALGIRGQRGRVRGLAFLLSIAYAYLHRLFGQPVPPPVTGHLLFTTFVQAVLAHVVAEQGHRRSREEDAAQGGSPAPARRRKGPGPPDGPGGASPPEEPDGPEDPAEALVRRVAGLTSWAGYESADARALAVSDPARADEEIAKALMRLPGRGGKE